MAADYMQDFFRNGAGAGWSQNPYRYSPQYDASGRIIGYGQPGNIAQTQNDSPTFDATRGVWVSKTTGQPWSWQATQPAQAKQPQFTVTKTVKQPGVADATNNLLTRYNDNASALTQSFNDYLKQAQELNAQGRVQLAKDQAAYDPTDTINRLNTDVANTSGQLNAINRNYETNQRGISGEVANTDQGYAKTVADRLAKLKSDLNQQNSQYESAAQAVAGQAMDRAQKNISLYQLGGGTPASGSGDLTNRYIRAYADINVPLQQELAARRYSQTGFLNSEQSAADNQLYQNSLNELAGRSALESDLANRNYNTAQYTGNLDADTARQIFQLRTATAGMSRAAAANYLAQLQVPIEVGQRVLSGDISNLSNIAALDNAANYYTVSTPYDGSRVPPSPTYSHNFDIGNRNYSPSSPSAPVSQADAQAAANASIPTTQQLPRTGWGSTLVADQKTATGLQIYRDPKTGQRYYVSYGQVFPYPYDNPSLSNTAQVKPTNQPDWMSTGQSAFEA